MRLFPIGSFLIASDLFTDENFIQIIENFPIDTLLLSLEQIQFPSFHNRTERRPFDAKTKASFKWGEQALVFISLSFLPDAEDVCHFEKSIFIFLKKYLYIKRLFLRYLFTFHNRSYLYTDCKSSCKKKKILANFVFYFMVGSFLWLFIFMWNLTNIGSRFKKIWFLLGGWIIYAIILRFPHRLVVWCVYICIDRAWCVCNVTSTRFRLRDVGGGQMRLWFHQPSSHGSAVSWKTRTIWYVEHLRIKWHIQLWRNRERAQTNWDANICKNLDS